MTETHEALGSGRAIRGSTAASRAGARVGEPPVAEPAGADAAVYDELDVDERRDEHLNDEVAELAEG